MIVFDENFFTKKKLTLVVDVERMLMTTIKGVSQEDYLWFGVLPIDFEQDGALCNVSPEFWEWVPEQ